MRADFARGRDIQNGGLKECENDTDVVNLDKRNEKYDCQSDELIFRVWSRTSAPKLKTNWYTTKEGI